MRNTDWSILTREKYNIKQDIIVCMSFRTLKKVSKRNQSNGIYISNYFVKIILVIDDSCEKLTSPAPLPIISGGEGRGKIV